MGVVVGVVVVWVVVVGMVVLAGVPAIGAGVPVMMA